MADLADIEDGLVTLLATALLPGVAYLPGAYQAMASGTQVKIVRGWPLGDALMSDLNAGRAVVSVFSEHGMTRNVSRWPALPVQASTLSPGISAAVSGVTVILGGSIRAGDVAGIQFGLPLRAYAYVVQATDTLVTVAAALAGKISGASATGAVITLPSGLRLTAATAAPQTALTVIRQQEQGVRISVWAPTPAVRDALAAPVDCALSGLKTASGFLTAFFAVTPYESARLAFRAGYTNDVGARDKVWRRDFVYTVEYPTTLIEQDPVMLFSGGTGTIGITASTQQIGALAP